MCLLSIKKKADCDELCRKRIHYESLFWGYATWYWEKVFEICLKICRAVCRE